MRQDLAQSRIGDVERDRAIHELSDHFAAGRLDLDEFEERSATLLRAKTQVDVNRVLFDLPRPNRGTRTVARESPRRNKFLVSVVCGGIAAVSILLGIGATSEDFSVPVSVCGPTVQHDCVQADELQPEDDQPR